MKNKVLSTSLRASFSAWAIAAPAAILLAMSIGACASRAPAAAAPVMATAIAAHAAQHESPDPVQSSLSQAILDGLTGLPLEPAADRERLERESRTIAATHKHRGASATRRSHAQACLADEPRDAYEAIFCRLWLEAAGIHHPHAKRHHSLSRTREGRKRLHALLRAIAQAQVDRLKDATELEVYEALRKTPRRVSLRPLIEAALGNQHCASSALLAGLGLKTEEYFPDTDYRELVEALYARAAECETTPAAVKGGYRLGLLQIWDQNYAQAQKTLEKVTDSPAAEDYRSRIVYWRYFCAKQMGDSSLRDKMKDILAKDYHLTLHGLITVGPKPTDNHPYVTFRSAIRPQFNAPVRVAEALLEQGAPRDAVQALEPMLEAANETEPAFQLYLGVLLMRAGDSVHKFKLLTGLYREFPGLLSRESLEMLFPLHRFEVIQHYGKAADPFLVMSLIRQESAFNEHARSPVGAVGLMQLMPRTARRMERISRRSLYDPKVNIRIGVRFFSRLSERYGGEAELALAAYNAGPENVDTWQERYPVPNRLLFVDLIPFRETREYVASIARNYYWYKRLYEEQPAAADTINGPAPAAAQTSPGTAVPGAAPKSTFFKLFES